MKTAYCSAAVVLFCSVVTIYAQQRDVDREWSQPVVTERGLHHRLAERSASVVQPDGSTREITTSYVELVPGLHYVKDDQLLESKAEFKLVPGGAAATEGPLQLILMPDIAQEGAVDFVTPDAKRFVSSPRWLAYYDRVTGENAIIAAVKSCVGELVGPNVVIYADAFDDIRAALRYTYQPWGVEQDVIFLESGPLRPDLYGMHGDPANIVLEMWSEFHTAPVPDSITPSTKAGLPDVSLDFGATRVGEGKAFSIGNDDGVSIPVGKTWTKTDDRRQFLIEAVRQTELAPLLAGLPLQAQAGNPGQKARNLAQGAPAEKTRSALLAKGRDRIRSRERRTELASIQRTSKRIEKGVVIDYSIVTTVSNFRFKGNTTYYVTNSVTLSGTTTIDGGAVIKFANATNAGSNRLLITGPIDCQTSPYRPAFLTAKDDDTVGQIISGSTGDPGTNRYGGRVLDLNATSTSYDLHNLRIRYPDRGIHVSASTATLNLSHSQIGYANTAIYNVYPGFVGRNLLLFDSLYALYSASTITSRFEHVTFHRIGTLRSSGTALITNSLLICVTNGVSYSGSGVQESLSDTGVFQTVGAGARYLANQSTYRNAGTTGIDPTLASELRKRTTYPPVNLGGDFVVNTTLQPQAVRDTDLPDCGYHYDPIDWAWSGKSLTNTTLTLANGTAIAFYDSSTALNLYSGSRVTGSGTPLNLNRIAPYFAVQEQPVLWGSARPAALFGLAETNPATPPVVDLKFTGIDLFQGSSLSQQDFVNTYNTFGQLALNDCQVRGGSISIVPQINFASQQLIAFTNCVIHWTLMNLQHGYLGDATPVIVHLRNNLFRTNNVTLYNHTNTTTWTANENVFDSVTLTGPPTGFGKLDNTNNAYYATATLPKHAGSITLGALDFVAGPLGNYYYPTNGANLATLLNAGTRTADLSGLYHFTTTTNQLRETNSTVDIGFHYIGLNASGVPVNTESDAVADYLEDINGNGGLDSGETDWQVYNSTSASGNGPGLVSFTPLK
ncbi:MAG: hypothetical protein IPK15_05110 [Verrucomicrobia bacterium]|nr:hypothetical protein [Verrucomicrobiota bacterium]